MIVRKEILAEYNSEENSPLPGGNGKPYWNINAMKFMYVPKLHFPSLPHYNHYRYTAIDTNKEKHVFESPTAEAYLTPIWHELPQGIIVLKVEALDLKNQIVAIMGVRTFYKSDGFYGIENFKKAKRSYKEASTKAFDYIFNQESILYWLDHETPDPNYDLYVYPSKMVDKIIRGSIDYSKLHPSKREMCMQIAKRAADYLIRISNENHSKYAGLPLTYYYQFREQYEGINNETAKERMDYLHLTDSVNATDGLLYLYEQTREKRYFDVALHMACFLKENIKPNGSFPMFLSLKENKPVFENEAVPYPMVHFLKHFYHITHNEEWLMLANQCIQYIEKILEVANFEGQFEDSTRSDNYSNLSIIMAVGCLEILLEKENKSKEYIQKLESLMRFIEDQFIIWDKPCPFHPSISNKNVHDPSEFYYPAGLEQYQWYIPIDSSTASAIKGYMALYKKNHNPILIEKAKVLANAITNMQNDTNGMIPTQWYRKSCIEDGGNLWINCLIETAEVLKKFDDFLSEIEKK